MQQIDTLPEATVTAGPWRFQEFGEDEIPFLVWRSFHG